MFALAVIALLIVASGDPNRKAADLTNAPADTPSVVTAAGNLVTHPIWTRRPSRGDLTKLYPRSYRWTKATVVASCLINAAGELSSCDIVRESPAGLGFGDATISLSKLFQMKPTDRDGVRVAGRKLILPVVWYQH